MFCSGSIDTAQPSAATRGSDDVALRAIGYDRVVLIGLKETKKNSIIYAIASSEMISQLSHEIPWIRFARG